MGRAAVARSPPPAGDPEAACSVRGCQRPSRSSPSSPLAAYGSEQDTAAGVAGVAYVGSVDGNLTPWAWPPVARNGNLQRLNVTSSHEVDAGVVSSAAMTEFLCGRRGHGNSKWKFKNGRRKTLCGQGLARLQHVKRKKPCRSFECYLSSPSGLGGAVLRPGRQYLFPGRCDGNLNGISNCDVVHASPALADGTLCFIGSWDRFFYRLDAAPDEKRAF